MTKTFLIAGAAGGLGGRVVTVALAAGHNVVATDLVPDAVPVPQEHRDRLRVRALDVTDPASARDAVAHAVAEFGAVDVLVNSAGARSVGSIEDMPEDEFHRDVNVNFFGAVNTVRAVLPVMRPRRSGSIINLSTIGGRRNQPGLGAYQSSKWALGGFTEILAREVGPIGIRVTLVEPGGIRTPWAAAPMPVPDIHDEYEETVGAFARTYNNNPDVQRGDPTKMAAVILRLTEEPAPPTRLLLAPTRPGSPRRSPGHALWRTRSGMSSACPPTATDSVISPTPRSPRWSARPRRADRERSACQPDSGPRQPLPGCQRHHHDELPRAAGRTPQSVRPRPTAAYSPAAPAARLPAQHRSGRAPAVARLPISLPLPHPTLNLKE
ncbi:SDR family NAD(P)-dependent oxidoreductase [Streptomyces sp. NPDC049040]|uniref:SDR family NAD(P)-dependent oxidoreductase n=1 Tax=Streptomyces sp. NPDC049040 TaxID=3365593 RepID=UPI003710C784